jgi:hypothetical protein
MGAAAPAFADDAPREASRRAFRQGVVELQAGRNAPARDLFLEAYSLFPHPSILLNLGLARARVGEYVAAEQDLVRFLSDDGGASPEEIETARITLEQTRRMLGTLRVRVEPAEARATLDGAPIPLVHGAASDIRATVGEHLLVVERRGYVTARRTVRIEGGGIARVDVVLAADGPEGAPDPDAAPSSAAVAGGGRRTAGFVAVGGAAALAGAGVFFGLRAQSLADAYNTKGDPHHQDPDTRASGLLFRTAADVAFGAAIATAGLGAYLILSSPPKRATSAGAAVLLGPASVSVRGVF